jgi:hypothetical protein
MRARHAGRAADIARPHRARAHTHPGPPHAHSHASILPISPLHASPPPRHREARARAAQHCARARPPNRLHTRAAHSHARSAPRTDVSAGAVVRAWTCASVRVRRRGARARGAMSWARMRARTRARRAHGTRRVRLRRALVRRDVAALLCASKS